MKRSATAIKKILNHRFNRTCFLIGFMILISLEGISQQNLITTKRLYAESATNKITYAFEDSLTRQVVSIYSNIYELEKIKEDQSKSMEMANYEEGIIFDNGTKLPFKKHEAFLCYQGNAIYTKRILSDDSYVVKKYKIDYGSIKALVEKHFTGGLESQLYPLENSNNFIETDNFERYGTHFVLYSGTLDSIASFAPKNGFQDASFACNGNSIILFISPYQKKEKNKLVYLDAKNGKIKLQKDMDLSDFYVQFIIPFNNYYILKTSNSKLIAVDDQGATKWQKNDVELGASQLPDRSNIIQNPLNNELYLLTSTQKIVALNALNGNLKWEMKWDDLNAEGNYSKKITPLDFKYLSQSNEIAVIFGDLEKRGNEQYKIGKSHVNLISSIGKVMSKDFYKDGGNDIRLVTSLTSKNYYLINKNKISKYEKAN